MYGNSSASPPAHSACGYEYLREHGYEAVDGRGFTEDDIVADIKDCDAIIVRTAKITKRIFDAAPNLKILARHGAGYDGVDLEAAREHGVLVCTAGGANAISVAELTIFYMLYCSRNFKKVESLYLKDYRGAKMGVPKTELGGQDPGPGGPGQHRQAGGPEGRSGLQHDGAGL